jgi:hypothetical protein
MLLEKLRDIYPSTFCIWDIKSGGIVWERHVAHVGEKRNT